MTDERSTGDVVDERALSPADFPVHWPVDTRWSDNDVFGHLNNSVYYELFDTAINAWLRAGTGVDSRTADALQVVAESGCRYFSEIAFPQRLDVGLAVTRVGRSSVTYRLGLFVADDDTATAAAVGRWVHVYVDAATRRPVSVPADVRAVLAAASLAG